MYRIPEDEQLNFKELIPQTFVRSRKSVINLPNMLMQDLYSVGTSPLVSDALKRTAIITSTVYAVATMDQPGVH